MATILMTGATGAVGHAVVPSLKERGHRIIYLTRGDNPASRIRSAIGQFVTDDDIFCSGDITQQTAGVSLADLARFPPVDHMLHLAASIKFDDALEAYNMNVLGVRNMLALARKLRHPMFHYMSTAYVAGDQEVFTEDDMDVGQNNFNVYERSKLEAEEIVVRWGCQSRIYRMGIMTGDSRTGYISSLSGYYGFLAPFWRLFHNIRERWERDPHKLRSEGIKFNSAGMLILPLRVRCSLESRLNLIPSDWLAQTLRDLMFTSSDHRVFHLVHPNPPKVQWVIEKSLQYMGIEGLSYGEGYAPTEGLLGYLQKALDRGLDQFSCYVTHGTRFSFDHTRDALGVRLVPPPDVDKVFFRTMIEYAKQQEFGRRMPVGV